MNSDHTASLLRRNLTSIRDRMDAAARRAGRDPSEVRLVAVTKYVDVQLAEQLFRAGCPDLGESRPQELWRKAAQLAGSAIRWHMIGHLQRNKAVQTARIAELIHSVDSERLLATLNQAGQELSRPVQVLLEVNVSREPGKTGLPRDAVAALYRRRDEFPWVGIRGLMAMSGLASGPDATRAEFRELRSIRDALLTVPPGQELAELSMGMSDDFEIAIEEGATLVRIGSALFEGLLP